jgi:ribosomal protein S18 acetylase RimI-like enzyme
MSCDRFSKDHAMHLTLGNGYVLASAPEREFGVHYAVYRDANPDFEDFLEYGSDLEGLNYCFWVVLEDQRIGGVIIRPNHIEGLFLIPPHTGRYEILRSVLPLLLSWSDKAQPIEATDVLPHELGIYTRLGFRIAGGRRCYIRPTEAFDITWEDRYELVTPGRQHLQEIAALFRLAYSGYPGELSRYSMDDWLRRTGRTLGPSDTPALCDRASTLLYDTSRELAVGACLTRLSRFITRPDVRVPKVSDIAVHPEYRRQGLGSRMLRKALTELRGQYATLRFGVALGNPAEAFYYSLGFLPGVTQYTLSLLP